jgi:hypothetical protein
VITSIFQVNKFLSRKAEARGQEAEGTLSQKLLHLEKPQNRIVSSILCCNHKEQGFKTPTVASSDRRVQEFSGSKSGGVELPSDLFLLPSASCLLPSSITKFCWQSYLQATSLINELKSASELLQLKSREFPAWCVRLQAEISDNAANPPPVNRHQLMTDFFKECTKK